MPIQTNILKNIDIKMLHVSKDHTIVTDTFVLDIELADKTSSIVNNVGRALVKKKVLMLGSKE